jgi:hypothetical protein
MLSILEWWVCVAWRASQRDTLGGQDIFIVPRTRSAKIKMWSIEMFMGVQVDDIMTAETVDKFFFPRGFMLFMNNIIIVNKNNVEADRHKDTTWPFLIRSQLQKQD